MNDQDLYARLFGGQSAPQSPQPFDLQSALGLGAPPAPALAPPTVTAQRDEWRTAMAADPSASKGNGIVQGPAQPEPSIAKKVLPVAGAAAGTAVGALFGGVGAPIGGVIGGGIGSLLGSLF